MKKDICYACEIERKNGKQAKQMKNEIKYYEMYGKRLKNLTIFDIIIHKEFYIKEGIELWEKQF